MGEADKNSLVGQIGQILGVLRPIPGQLTTLFDKVETEGRERLDADGKIRSDLRSAREELARLKESYEDDEEREKELQEQIRVLQVSVAELTVTKKSVKALLVSVGGHFSSIALALLIAYLAFKFGWV